MKSVVAFGVIALAGAVSAAPCDISAVLGGLTPLAADPNLATCSNDSGYNLLVSGASGIPPTDDELAKISSSTACKTLYANLGGIVSNISPSCTLGGVETSTFATLPLQDALAAIFTAVKSANVTPPTDTTTGHEHHDHASTTTAPSTANASTTTTAPSTANASTTPAPSTAPESSATISAVSLAAVGLAVYSMTN
ncbi:hypothetical protein B5M09_013529 [Aphanomyces astaci]|uniref:Elicitin n=1 Tax=Aphanomyces astaci TaxID=112090 RepID=A0A425DKQ8_APHAT|nr:hypothetical protein B5M09_013529 [Aphanomyces astaci]